MALHSVTEERGIAAYAALTDRLRVAFPDMQFTLQDLIASEDRVVVRWTMDGTHAGPLAGIPATGKRVQQRANVIYRLADGKIAEGWALMDQAGMLRQLGFDPLAAARPRSRDRSKSQRLRANAEENCMRLLVLGATGGIGKYLLEYATARGHEVTAFARSPQKIVLKSEKLRVIPGDLLNVDQLAQVLPGHDAVLSAFGPATLRRVTTRREFGKALAAAMQRSGVRRALVVSSALLFAEQNAIGKLLQGNAFPQPHSGYDGDGSGDREGRAGVDDGAAAAADEWAADAELPRGRWAFAEGDDRLACLRCGFHGERGGTAGTRAADCGSLQIEFVTDLHEGDEMKVAVITGAAQGIGRRTAEVLAEAGYALALLDVRRARRRWRRFARGRGCDGVSRRYLGRGRGDPRGSRR